MVVGFASVFVVLLTLVILFVKTENRGLKIFFFVLLVLPVIGATVYITGDTLTKVAESPAKGPVHWHADYRVYRCGAELDLINPTGMSNKIGTATIHEHGDKRIHVEGLITSLAEVSLGSFFKIVGGEMTEDKLVFPTNSGLISMKNGDLCTDGNTGALQVFLWETKDKVATQRKLMDFPIYVMKPEELIPPGDCIIVEFGSPKDKTSYTCEQYDVAAVRGVLEVVK